MCRIHAHSLRGFRSVEEAADYSGGLLLLWMWPLPGLSAAPLSGESVVLPVKVTPKNTQLTDRKQEVRQSSGEEKVWHTSESS